MHLFQFCWQNSIQKTNACMCNPSEVQSTNICLLTMHWKLQALEGMVVNHIDKDPAHVELS